MSFMDVMKKIFDSVFDLFMYTLYFPQPIGALKIFDIFAFVCIGTLLANLIALVSSRRDDV